MNSQQKDPKAAKSCAAYIYIYICIYIYIHTHTYIYTSIHTQQKDPKARPTASELTTHPFILSRHANLSRDERTTRVADWVGQVRIHTYIHASIYNMAVHVLIHTYTFCKHRMHLLYSHLVYMPPYTNTHTHTVSCPLTPRLIQRPNLYARAQTHTYIHTHEISGAVMFRLIQRPQRSFVFSRGFGAEFCFLLRFVFRACM